MNLIDNPQGNYRFLSGIAPYSSGVVAMPGYEIVHLTLHDPIPYQAGFALIERHLAEAGRPRQALCAIELRSPRPFTFAGFAAFNQGYQAILAEWEILLAGHNPVARTNVAPEVEPPAEPVLYAFSYTMPAEPDPAGVTFVVAGAGELTGGALNPAAVVRPGQSSPEAMAEKAAQVMAIMQARLAGLQAGWDQVTAVDLYTVHPLHTFLVPEILAVIGPAARHGLRWFYSRPPIKDLDFEMDMRGIRRELRL
jgi:hypothetical protein